MSIWQMAGVALLSAMLLLLLRELRGTAAFPLRLATTVFFLAAAVTLFLPILTRLHTLFGMAQGTDYATPVLRAVGIALICEFTAAFCRDLGESTVAEGVLLFGRLEIVVLALPMVDQLVEIAREMLQW